MGINCKPIKKLESMFRKVDNLKEKEKQEMRNKEKEASK